MQGMCVQSLGQEDPLEEDMATHSSIFAWRITQRSLVGYSPLVAQSWTRLKQLRTHALAIIFTDRATLLT